MALAIELKRRLDNNDSPLCKRIRMAEDIFKSNNFPLTSHRNITLNWLCNLADNSTDDFSWIESIKKCFGTPFAYADLDNSLIENLIKILLNKLESQSLEIVDGLISVIDNTSVQKYFVSNLPLWNKVIVKLIKACTNTNNQRSEISLYINKIIAYLINLHKIALDQDIYYENVLKGALVNLISLLDKIEDEDLNNKCVELIQNCVFTKDSTKFIEHFMDVFDHLEAKECSELAFKILCVAYIKAYKESSNIIKLFKRIIECNKNNKFYPCILVDIFKIEDVSLEIEDNGETLMSYLQKYSMDILSSTVNSDKFMFLFLNSAILLNPLIIEPQLKEFLIKSMLMKKESTEGLLEFSTFLKHVVQTLSKLNRVHKLPLLLLNDLDAAIQVECASNENVKSDYHIEQIWPLEVAEHWGNSMEGLNASITWNTLQSLLYTLDNKGILNSKDDTNIFGASVMTQVILRFITSFLKNCKLPLMSKENYTKLWDHSKKSCEILAKVALIIVKEKLHGLLVHWLETVYIVGEFIIMLKYYWNCMDTQLQLQLIEQYFNEKQWNKLCKLVKESDCTKSKDYLNNIHLQKLRYKMMMIHSLNNNKHDLKEELKVVYRNWENILNSKLIFKSLLPLMTQAQVIELVNNSIHDIVKPNNLHILQSDYIQENNNFISVTLYSIFHEIAKLLSKSVKIVEEFNISEILDDKQKFLISIGETLEQDFVVESPIVDVAALEIYLKALVALNLQFLDNTTKCSIYFFIISVFAYLCEVNKLVNDDSNYQGLVEGCRSTCGVILAHVLESGTSFNVDDYISSTVYLKISSWISKTELIQPVIEMSMKENANIIPKLNKVVKKIHKNYQSLPDDSIPSKLHELLIVPTICLTLSTKMKKLHKEQRALVTKLRNKCVDIVHNIITKYSSNAPLEILLPSYNQLLQLWINNIEARDDIKDIVTVLPIYLKYSMDTIQIKSKGDAHSFIMLVTRNQKHFMENLPENFVLDLWDVYYKINCNIQNISSTETVLALLESCDDKQFEEIILKLNDNTIKSMECEKDFPNSINLWVNITEGMLSGNKTKLRLEILTKLCQDLLALITKGHYTNGTNTLVIMKFFLTITKNPLLQINVLVIESILSAVFLTPSDDLSTFGVDLFKTCSEIVNFTLLKRTALILDRLPVVIYGIRYLIKILARWSASKESDSVEKDSFQSVLADLGHSIEKVFTSLIKLKRNLSRPAYLMHDVIVELSSYTLTNEIKQSLLNCCYQIHSLCDSHALKYLNTVSSVANREIFKNIHETYNKFHMFKGKI